MIIDVEAEASADTKSGPSTAKTTSADASSTKASTTKASAGRTKASVSQTASPTASTGAPASGLDEATAEAAGLSAKPDTASADIKMPRSEKHTSETGTPNATSDGKSKQDTSDDAAAGTPPAPPAGKSEPSPFYLFAAGLIGALLALVLMFLASVVGLFSLSDGRVEEQARTLAALEARVQAVEAQSADETGFDTAVLAPLESDIAALHAELESVLSMPAGDGALADDAFDVEAALAEALAPLEARLGEVEAQLQSTVASFAALGGGEAVSSDGAAPVVVPDPALANSVEALNDALGGVRADLDGVQAALADLSARQDAVPPETGARLEALEGLLADAGMRIDGLGAELASLSSSLTSAMETVDVRLGAMTTDITTLAEAPVAQAPDRLARLGVALDAVVAARDAGQDVAMALGAAEAAASFDGALSASLAPVVGDQVSGALSTASLRSAYDDTYDAMRAAAPPSEGGGLLGALEDRARQMVTIRAPEGGAVLGGGNEPLAQLDALGSLIASERFADALAVATRLPAAMQQAGNGLIDSLHARVALDDALANARLALVAALSQSDNQADQEPAGSSGSGADGAVSQ
ncbi:MAG: hypothetical protein JJ908_12160 [Rhizobiales bacterium]|nr:hypothetical protein [Hyphomicrobiales bacterium]MBO6699579.1 hypothetical protein [Hyphomicrobiales bacterium]MBO6737117.1 hypothetical protein [Hyphomicrobiales bacterium]MBO6911809.1 hypothetical protein [Hyphomicrobiales bacterium]MBO6954746.1 hypothetical protein [Hyphomicrobiales bacterium]